MIRSMLRIPKVLKVRDSSRATLYNDIKEGLFPKPVLIGKRAVAWPEDEVAAINEARIAGQSVEEIRALVAMLEANRKRAVALPKEEVAPINAARIAGQLVEEIRVLVAMLEANRKMTQ